jgi:ornithine cyclodeaminase/alanine dehydrogenase-like protein (mu-crystallin family)
MDITVLGEADIYRMLPMRECIPLMSNALAALTEGKAFVPLRMVVRLPDGSGFLGIMPGHLSEAEDGKPALGLKAVAIFPRNAARGLDTHQGAVLLMDADTGRLSAVMDAGAITAIRTAAVSGVATDLLARKDAHDLAILGAGVQARTHLEAIAAVRPLQRVRVWSRTAERAHNFVAEERQRYAFPIEAMLTAEAAVRGADIVTTVTASPDPVLQGGWVMRGAHVNAVGSSLPSAREVDTNCICTARIFVDRRESALAEAGDLLIPIREGALTPDQIVGELGEVITGRVPGRRSDGELTLFKSLGLAVEDVAAAVHVVRRAREAGAGNRVPM